MFSTFSVLIFCFNILNKLLMLKIVKYSEKGYLSQSTFSPTVLSHIDSISTKTLRYNVSFQFNDSTGNSHTKKLLLLWSWDYKHLYRTVYSIHYCKLHSISSIPIVFVFFCTSISVVLSGFNSFHSFYFICFSFSFLLDCFASCYFFNCLFHVQEVEFILETNKT